MNSQLVCEVAQASLAVRCRFRTSCAILSARSPPISTRRHCARRFWRGGKGTNIPSGFPVPVRKRILACEMNVGSGLADKS